MDDLEPITDKEKENILVQRLLGVVKWMGLEYDVHASTIVNGINRFKGEACDQLNKDDISEGNHD